MKPHQVESWALNVIERVKLHQPIEDSRVELKSVWIASEKAARLIAGHANAARGALILWLVGVDEKEGVKGAQHEELANWYQKVKEQFDGLAPQLSDYSIPVDNTTIVALLFQTDRAPFVVKNPAYGKPNGGPVALEVPWRENTSTRSATRSDLLRLLSPLQASLNFEILGGSLTLTESRYRLVTDQEKLELSWSLMLELYAEVSVDAQIVIPFHRCEATFEMPGKIDRTWFDRVKLDPPRTGGWGGAPSELRSLTINSTGEEILVGGPGKVYLSADKRTPMIKADFDDALITASCLPINADRAITLDVKLSRVDALEGEVCRWKVKDPSQSSEGA